VIKQDGFVIRYIDGWAWGITAGGATISLGTEESIIDCLENGTKADNKTVEEVLKIERLLRKIDAKQSKAIILKEKKEKVENHKRAVALGVARVRKTKK